MLLTMLAQETVTAGDIYKQILQKHTMLGINVTSQEKTHVSAMKQVELLSSQLRDSFRQYCFSKYVSGKKIKFKFN